MGKKIALTGGIGSGKSTVLSILKQMGYPVYSCDEIYREILESQAYVKKVEALFPSCIESGRINRGKLAEIVFKDEEKRKKLNALAHPLIMKTLIERMESEPNLSVAEVPLLWEGNYQELFDYIFIVTRNKDARVQAVLQRDKTTVEKVKGRMAAQVDYDTTNFLKKDNASKIRFIENNSSLQNLEEEIKNAVISIR